MRVVNHPNQISRGGFTTIEQYWSVCLEVHTNKILDGYTCHLLLIQWLKSPFSPKPQKKYIYARSDYCVFEIHMEIGFLENGFSAANQIGLG